MMESPEKPEQLLAIASSFFQPDESACDGWLGDRLAHCLDVASVRVGHSGTIVIPDVAAPSAHRWTLDVHPNRRALAPVLSEPVATGRVVSAGETANRSEFGTGLAGCKVEPGLVAAGGTHRWKRKGHCAITPVEFDRSATGT